MDWEGGYYRYKHQNCIQVRRFKGLFQQKMLVASQMCSITTYNYRLKSYIYNLEDLRMSMSNRARNEINGVVHRGRYHIDP